MESGSSKIIRFGVYELDLAARQLRKNGVRIKLQDQPFRVLQLLTERPSEIVSREELKEKLWSEDTFVEFDHGLNTAIQKIRAALGDSADNPRFIETVPRSGYRFVAPTEISRAGALPAKLESEKSAEPPAVERARRRRLSWIAVSAALLATAGLTWWLARSVSPAPDSRPQFKLTQLTSDTGLTFEPAISADGTLVAYASDRAGEGGLDIWVQQVSGGGAVRLTDHEADDRSPTFSPDGGRIAFRSERDGGGIYIMPALGGDAKLIAERGVRPGFSPDGKLIAYYTGEYPSGSLFVVPSDGGVATRLRAEFAGASHPIWLADGKNILFNGNHPDHGRDWWVAPVMAGPSVKTGAADRLAEHGLTPGSLLHIMPEAWQPAGNSVVFSARTGGSTNLWRIAISPETWKVTGPPERLTFGTGNEGGATVAADGRIGFSSLLLNQDVWALPIDPNMPAASDEIERLTTNPARDDGPSVSSDGRRLVFRSNRSGDWSLWFKDLDTGKETALTTPDPAYGQWPLMSPDGSKVAYTLLQGPKASMYVVTINQRIPERLCDACGGSPRSWSSDGSMVLHQREFDRTIHLWDVATGEQTEILRSSQRAPTSPRLSFDDRWITFKQDLQPERARVFVAPFQGGSPIPEQEWIAVTSGEFNDNKPRWSPAGTLIYFTSTRDGFACIWAIRLDPIAKRPTSEPFPVRHFHSARLSMSLYGLAAYELSVARDKLVFELTELTGNIWMLVPESGE